MVSFIAKIATLATIAISPLTVSSRPLSAAVVPCQNGDINSSECGEIARGRDAEPEFSADFLSKIENVPSFEDTSNDKNLIDEDKWCPERQHFGCACDQK